MIRFSRSNIQNSVASALDRFDKSVNELNNEELIGVMTDAIYESIMEYHERLKDFLKDEIRKASR